ncbi:hypothetical protein ACU5JM_09435 [Rhodococcus erythropolis]|uniref:hypothetical protein n=1 Tax=Rhodococcus erythropolis TaxID=1833 RepID=UPI00406BC77D
MRLRLDVFGRFVDLQIAQIVDEAVADQSMQPPFREVHHSAQTDFGFVKQLDYPDERWTDS